MYKTAFSGILAVSIPPRGSPASSTEVTPTNKSATHPVDLDSVGPHKPSMLQKKKSVSPATSLAKATAKLSTKSPTGFGLGKVKADLFGTQEGSTTKRLKTSQGMSTSSSSPKLAYASAHTQFVVDKGLDPMNRILEDRLGTLVRESIDRYRKLGGNWSQYVEESRGRSYLAETVGEIPHPAAPFLQYLREEGVPVKMSDPAWTPRRSRNCTIAVHINQQ